MKILHVQNGVCICGWNCSFSKMNIAIFLVENYVLTNLIIDFFLKIVIYENRNTVSVEWVISSGRKYKIIRLSKLEQLLYFFNYWTFYTGQGMVCPALFHLISHGWGIFKVYIFAPVNFQCLACVAIDIMMLRLRDHAHYFPILSNLQLCLH